MTKISRRRAAAIALIAIGASLAAASIAAIGAARAADPDMTAFKHPRQGFSIAYPADWRQATFKDGPEFQALANAGKGPEECNVNVTPVSGADYLDRINKDRMLNTIRYAMKDAQFTEWRRQTLARRWGVYYIVTGTTPRQNYRQTTLGFQVVVGSKLYTLSCSAPSARFEQGRPVFEKILSTLTF